jgi:hypothetical protein
MVVILAFISAGLFAAVVHFKKSAAARNAKGGPIIAAEKIAEKNSPSGGESEALLNELQSIADRLGPSPKKEKVEEVTGQISIDESAPEVAANNAVALKIKPLHWHFQYAALNKDVEIKKELNSLDIKLQKESAAEESLLSEIEALKLKIRQVDFGKQYSKEDEEAKTKEALQSTMDLDNKEEELKTLSQSIDHLKEEKRGAEDALQSLSRDGQRKEADSKRKLLDAITALNIKLDYQNYDILAFAATGEKIKDIVHQILSISDDSFKDFTASAPVSLDKEHKATIYLANDRDSALHWHIKESGIGKKADLFNAIRELGGMIDYDLDELAVFTISSAQLKDLRIRIQSMRMPLAEYGGEESNDNALNSGPVTISVNFNI